jgi:hypothetical protein
MAQIFALDSLHFREKVVQSKFRTDTESLRSGVGNGRALAMGCSSARALGVDSNPW